MTESGVGSVGLPIPRSMISTPATRFSYFILLMRPKRYGGRRWMRCEGSILKLESLITVPFYRRGRARMTSRAAQFEISDLKSTIGIARFQTPGLVAGGRATPDPMIRSAGCVAG